MVGWIPTTRDCGNGRLGRRHIGTSSKDLDRQMGMYRRMQREYSSFKLQALCGYFQFQNRRPIQRQTRCDYSSTQETISRDSQDLKGRRTYINATCLSDYN